MIQGCPVQRRLPGVFLLNFTPARFRPLDREGGLSNTASLYGRTENQ
jgi:hypothetical protein